MSQQLVVENTLKWAQPILKNQGLQINGQEPALTFANFILQRMTGPPFRWRTNRKNLSFPLSAGVTDYAITVADLGHIESDSAWIVDNTGKRYACKGRLTMEQSSLSDRPSEYAPVYDNGTGLITFRVKPAPDSGNYTLFGDYQVRPPLIMSFAQPWGTVSDDFSYIFNAGFLSLGLMLINSTQAPIWERYFIGSLLGAQEGLDQQAIDIFLGQWTNYSRTIAAAAAAQQGGTSGRGL